MDFTFSEEQDAVRDLATQVFEGHATPERVKEVERSEERGYAAGWWSNRAADGGLVDDRLPEDAYWAQGHDGQRLYVVPSQRLVVARLGFSPEAEDLRTEDLVAELVRLGSEG